MVTRLTRLAPAAALLAAIAAWTVARPVGQATGMPSAKNGDWTHYSTAGPVN
jgi:hypothetical protein